jgi:phosphoserine phosphatase
VLTAVQFLHELEYDMRIEPVRPDAAPEPRLPIGSCALTVPAFTAVVIDVEAAMPALECFAWLAQRRGDIVRRRVADLAAKAEREGMTSANLYRERLALIRPRRDDLDSLASAYVAQLPPEAAFTVRRLKYKGVRVVLVSAGLRYALLRVGARLELDLADIHGVDVRFDALGAYTGFDALSPLARIDGKGTLLAQLDLGASPLVPKSLSQLASLA